MRVRIRNEASFVEDFISALDLGVPRNGHFVSDQLSAFSLGAVRVKWEDALEV